MALATFWADIVPSGVLEHVNGYKNGLKRAQWSAG